MPQIHLVVPLPLRPAPQLGEGRLLSGLVRPSSGGTDLNTVVPDPKGTLLAH
jgi:hypothetical protein